MDQKPVAGQEALVPPDAETARRYLEEARAVTGRRQRAVDRRALAWLQIVSAVVTAAFLVASVIALRRPADGGAQALLFAFLVYGQIFSGSAQRSGLQWRFTRGQWPLVVSGAAAMVLALVAFGFAVFVPDVPWWVAVLPGALVLLVFGGYGAVRLARASSDPPGPDVPRVPLPRGARVGTLGVGVVLGALLMLSVAPAGVLASVLLLLLALCVLAWFCAGATDLGLPAIGALWRWPHEVGLAIGFALLVGLTVFDVGRAEGGATAGVIAGCGVVLLFVGLTFVPGRGARG
jgi:hypothetical protein